MNTQTVTGRDKVLFEAHLFRLMFDDGFGFDEALAHAPDYARCIFRKASPTAVLRITTTLTRLESEALRH